MIIIRFLMVILIIIGLLLIPFGSNVRADAGTGTPPPVGQPLVREGDFAMQLAQALYLGTPQNDADAESMLQSVEISPKNGWIADYPITPNILMELKNAVAAAAENRQLGLEKDIALQALEKVADQFGLPLSSEVENNEAGGGSPTPYDDENPAWLDRYYDDNGPPVITYYPPPPAYLYLYAWVPYPFWYSDYFFTGYYCLRDFDRTIYVGGASRILTNHVIDNDNGEVFIINPVTGRRGKFFKMEGGFVRDRDRHRAGEIYRRGVERERRERIEHHERREGRERIDHRGREHDRKGQIQRRIPGPDRPARMRQQHLGTRNHHDRDGVIRRQKGDKGNPHDRDEKSGRNRPAGDRSFRKPQAGNYRNHFVEHHDNGSERFHRNESADKGQRDSRHHSRFEGR